MHERTRRAISRMMFVFCCAVPTGFVMAMIAWTWTPWARRAEIAAFANDISTLTGAVVDLQSVRRLSPGHAKLDGIVLRDPETDGEIIRVRSLEVSLDQIETAMVLQQPELQSAQLAAAWRMFENRFLRRADLTAPDYQIAANDFTMHSAAHSLTLRDVDAWIESNATGVTGNLKASLSSQPSTAPILISVRRDRGDQPSTTWTLATGPHRLPLAVVSEFKPGLIDLFGPNATLQGTLTWTIRPDGDAIDLSGCRFDDVALDRMMVDSPHRLSGTATIELQRGRIERAKHVDLAGTIIAVDGLVSDELLLSAANHLQCEIADVLGAGDMRYDRLALHFQINDSQMRLEGICRTLTGLETLPVGIAICSGGQALLSTSPDAIESIRLVSLFAPTYSVPVPLASQNHALAAWLIPPSRMPIDSRRPLRPKIRTATGPRGGPVMSQPPR